MQKLKRNFELDYRFQMLLFSLSEIFLNWPSTVSSFKSLFLVFHLLTFRILLILIFELSYARIGFGGGLFGIDFYFECIFLAFHQTLRFYLLIKLKKNCKDLEIYPMHIQYLT